MTIAYCLRNITVRHFIRFTSEGRLWYIFVTMFTLIWLFSSVCPQVDFKITILWEHLVHSLQWYGFSPVCILKWLLRVAVWEKDLSHWLHWYGFSPVCVLKWSLRSRFCENILVHSLQWYGISSVCILKWLLRVAVWEKDLAYWLHWYGFEQHEPNNIYALSPPTHPLLIKHLQFYIIPFICQCPTI